MDTRDAWSAFGEPDFVVYPFDVERYCIDSLLTVGFNGGGNCNAHRWHDAVCTTDVRPATNPEGATPDE